MPKRDDVIDHLNCLLDATRMADYGPNGLQVEGKDEVMRIVTGVTASDRFLDEAARRGADLVVVHHGVLWNHQAPVVRGALKKRLTRLLDAGMTLLAYHLPLDRHAEHGNNAPALRDLGVSELLPFALCKGSFVGWKGVLAVPLPVTEFVRRVEQYYDVRAVAFLGGPPEVRTVGLVSGAAQGELSTAVSEKLDAFITGEVSEYNYHLAHEEGIHHLSVGHHASERVGPRRLAAHLSAHFGIEATFLDVPNPV